MAQRAVVATLLAVVALVLHLTVARQLDDLGVFAESDVLFDTDIASRLRAFSAGNHLGIKHPNLMPYFTPSIALATKVIVTLRPASGPQPELQRTLATLLVPAASALKTALVFGLFCSLGFSLLPAVVATLLEMVSFTTLIFGSIPESYGLTALAIAMSYACVASSGPDLTWRRVAIWLAIGVFATGVTVTNVVSVAVLFWAAAWKTEPRLMAATMRAAVFAIVVFGMTGVSAYVLDAMLVPRETSSAESVARDAQVMHRVTDPLRYELERFLAADPARKLRRFPTSVANAFAPSRLETMSTDSRQGSELEITLERSPNVFGLGDPFGLSLVLLVVAGAVCSLALPTTRLIAAVSVGILAFCWLLTVWGKETHLYSQHWHLAAVVLLAGVMRAGANAKLMTVLLGVLTLVIAVNNLMLLREMLALLAAAPTRF